MYLRNIARLIASFKVETTFGRNMQGRYRISVIPLRELRNDV